jgi:hypothetical protein
MTNPADWSTFVPVGPPQVITSANVWEQKEIPLSAYVPTDPINPGTYIALACIQQNAYAYYYIDDFVIEEMPNCPTNYNLTSSVHSATQVELNWSNNSQNSTDAYTIIYGDAATFDITNNTTYSTIAVPYSIPMTYMVGPLFPNTTYKFAIMQDCGGAWSNIVTTTTPAVAATLPYSTDFGTTSDYTEWQFLNGTQSNKFYIGEGIDPLNVTGYAVPPTSTDHYSLYVSNDAGLTNAYSVATSGNPSRTYAYRDFEIPVGTGELKLSFDWRAKGNAATTDFLRMYWMPVDVAVTAGNNPPGTYDSQAQIGNYTGGAGEHWLSNSTTWQHKEMAITSQQFPNLAGRTWRLYVHWRNENTASAQQPPAAIDNLEIIAVNCAQPSGLAATAITTTGAHVAWTETGTAVNWNLYYKAPAAATYTVVSVTGGIPAHTFTNELIPKLFK